MSDEALSASNAQAVVVTDYGPDSHNPSAGLIQQAFMRLHGFLTPVMAGGDTDPGNQFFGDGPKLQNFVGMANPATTNVIRNGGYAELSDVTVAGPMGDPARRIFADRLRRRSAL